MSGFLLIEGGTDIFPRTGSYFFFSQTSLGGMRDYEPNVHVFTWSDVQSLHTCEKECVSEPFQNK